MISEYTKDNVFTTPFKRKEKNEVLFLIAIAVSLIFVATCHNTLKKYKNIFYAIAAIITILSATVNFSGLPDFINDYVIALFTRGVLSTALWCVVMWAGALPNGSKAIKTVMPIRAELSITAAILTLGHNIGFGKTYFVMMFTSPEKMSANQLTAGIITIILLLIMIPLTIMSFPSVRKKFEAKKWKKIQRTAYIFYALIYVHIMTLYIPMAKLSRNGYLLSIAVYSIVFIGYAVFRIRKQLIIRKKIKPSGKNAAISTISVLTITCIAVLIAKPVSETAENISDVTEETTISDYTESTAKYKDGIYNAKAYGFDGDIEITVIIENGVIADISGVTYESDESYFELASAEVFKQILESQNTTVDAVSGATYSSNAIMMAAETALSSAEN